jgi:hypothetical protein
MADNYLSASDGTGHAVLAHVQDDRAIGNMTLVVDSHAKWPTNFIATTGTAGPDGYILEASKTEFKGHTVSGNIIIESFEPGSTDVGNSRGQIAVIKQTTGWANAVSNISTQTEDWRPLATPEQVSAILPLGNRSYTVVLLGSVGSILSSGMKLEFTWPDSGNSSMAQLNGVNQYFTKVNPTGGLASTVDNFTIMAYVVSNNLIHESVIARSTANLSDSMELIINANEQVGLLVRNGGNENSRVVYTYASLPLNKTVHVAATWNTGVVKIYFDGVLQAVKPAVTSGTAPTTAGLGGDWSVGRLGAYDGGYFAGNISNVGVWSNVLPEAIIKRYQMGPLTPDMSTTGGWNLDGGGADISNQNNLTAVNGANFNRDISPHHQMADGVVISKSVGLAIAVSNGIPTVQMPEGCTPGRNLPSISYSTQANPYGWVPINNVLAYAKVCVPFGTSTRAPIPGMRVSCFVPARKTLKVSAFLSGITSSIPNAGGFISIIDETENNREVTRGFGATNGSGDLESLNASILVDVLSSGTRTFRVEINIGVNASTINTNSSVTAPGYIMVEMMDR